ncbi:MAG: hypothetical protein ABIV13_03565 [Fimbriimonadales bacterium]
MNEALIALAAFAGLLAAAWFFSKRRQIPAPRQRFRIEFWVFCAEDQRPTDADIMRRISAAPFAKGGIRNEDARMIADIRFNIGRAKRQRNAMLFRPDVIGDSDAEIDETALAAIEDVDNLINVRFASDAPPVEPKRYLRLATYVVEAVCDLCRGVAIWDAVKQDLFLPGALRGKLEQNADGAAYEHHVDVRWGEIEGAGMAFTRGMEKIGLPDLSFDDQPLDQRTLATFIVEETAKLCWEGGTLTDSKFSGFGEDFTVEVGKETAPSPRHAGPIVGLRAFRYRPSE